MQREDLLQPSLSGAGGVRGAPYSSGYLFLVGFLGGAWGAMLMGLLNSHRLGRLARDVPVYLCLVAIAMGYEYWRTVLVSPLDFQHYPAGILNQGWRIMGLLTVGVSWWLHRREHKAGRLVGENAPRPLLASIGAIVLGRLILRGVLRLFAQLAGGSP